METNADNMTTTTTTSYNNNTAYLSTHQQINNDFYPFQNEIKTTNAISRHHHHHQQHHHHHSQQGQVSSEGRFSEALNYWNIKDEALPMPTKLDKFQLWPNGYLQLVYSQRHAEACTHQSGWAMRNTNNHDSSRLKKSCLGVMLCSVNCKGTKTKRCKDNKSLSPAVKADVNEDEEPLVHVRPFICDKARSKQKGLSCPTTGCQGILVQVKCTGHGGKPVTHVWRTIGGVVYFQCKGVHDHPPPQPKTCPGTRNKSKLQNCEGNNDDDDVEELTIRKRRSADHGQIAYLNERKVKKKRTRRSNNETTEVSSTTIDCGSMMIGGRHGEFQAKRSEEDAMHRYFTTNTSSTSSISTQNSAHPYFPFVQHPELVNMETNYHKNNSTNYFQQYGSMLTSSGVQYQINAERKTLSAECMDRNLYNYPVHTDQYHRNDQYCFHDNNYYPRRPHSNHSSYEYQQHHGTSGLLESTADWSRVWSSHAPIFKSTPLSSGFNSFEGLSDYNQEYMTLRSQPFTSTGQGLLTSSSQSTNHLESPNQAATNQQNLLSESSHNFDSFDSLITESKNGGYF